MCGRFTLASPAETISERFGPFDAAGDPDEVPELADAVPPRARAVPPRADAVPPRADAVLPRAHAVPELTPRYNIAPTQPVAVVRAAERGGSRLRRLETRRWGLVPHFARALAGPPLFNARAETLGEKPAFRDAYRRRRCIVPADGFFEWQKVAERRQPFLIRRQDGAPFAMAGLWDRWASPRGETIDSCTIVTTRANALLAPLHDRMPVVLPDAALEAWLDPTPQPPDALSHWLAPAPETGWLKYPVDPLVNRASHDAPGNVEPVFDEAP